MFSDMYSSYISAHIKRRKIGAPVAKVLENRLSIFNCDEDHFINLLKHVAKDYKGLTEQQLGGVSDDDPCMEPCKSELRRPSYNI